MIPSELSKRLLQVRRRLWLRSVLTSLRQVLLTGAAACVLLNALRILMAVTISVPLQVLVAAVVLIVVAAVRILGQRSLMPIARLIDERCSLKDRISTAVEFSKQGATSDLEQLQILDAVSRLPAVDVRTVVPLQWNRKWAWTVFSLLAAAVMTTIPGSPSASALAPQTPVAVSRAADQLLSQVESMEDLAEETGMDELRQLAAQLRQDVKTLQRPGLDFRNTLQTMSQMQQRMQKMSADLNVDAMDAQLEDVAEAMKTAEAFRPVADALKAGKLDRAAEELDKLDAKDLQHNEARALSEKLAEAAAAAEEKKLESLKEDLSKLADAIDEKDSEQTEAQSRNLAQDLRQHDLRKKVAQMLKSKTDQLADSKQLMAVESNSEGDGQMPGDGLNEAKGESNSNQATASRKAGAKSAGNIDGKKTQLDSERQMAELSGQLGEDGETDTEKTTATEDSAEAHRKAVETFARYEKLSEAVLDTEQIPSGYRQTIRRYFENIRPSAAPQDSSQ